jgi:hypothetical protein
MHPADTITESTPQVAAQPADGLGQSNPSTGDAARSDGLGQFDPSTSVIVCRGREALDRKRRDYDDWCLIGEALDEGRIEIMRILHTDKPRGKKYQSVMGKWLKANGFDIIDKGTRSCLLGCLEHRAKIEAWRAELQNKDPTAYFSLNHPTTVMRAWKKATKLPNPDAQKKQSAYAKLEAANIELQERLHHTEHLLEVMEDGADWSSKDSALSIADLVVRKMKPDKAMNVAVGIIDKLKSKKPPKTAYSNDPAVSGEQRKAEIAERLAQEEARP